MQNLLNFLEWYYFRAPKAQLIFAKNICFFIEDSFAVITNLVYFFKPWYGDNSLVGRLLSICIRLIMITTGIIALALFGLLTFSVPVVWIGCSILIAWYPQIIIAPLLGLLYFLLIGQQKPKVAYPHLSKPAHLKDAMVGSARDALLLFPSPLFYKALISSSKIVRFTIKTQLPIIELLQHIQATSTTLTQNQLLARLHELTITHQLRHIRLPHIVCALLYENADLIEPMLVPLNHSLKELANYLEWDEYEYLRARPPLPFDVDYENHSGGGTNRARLGVITPNLNSVSTDYTTEATHLRHELRIVRPQLIEQIEQILQKQENANVILNGEKGIGKETIIWQIASLILVGDLKHALWSKRILGLDIPAIIAKSASAGVESFVATLRDEIKRSRNIVLYINDIQGAVEQAKSYGSNILTMIEELLQLNETSLIISCTPAEYSLLKEYNPRLLQLAETIDIPEATQAESLQITHLHSLELEAQYEVIVPYPSINTTVTYAKNYIHQAPFPQNALTLLEDTVIMLSRDNELMTRTPWGLRHILLERHIARTLTEKTHIPVGSVQKSEADTLLHLNKALGQEIAGQQHAIEAITNVLQRNRAGVRNQTRPIGSFLFAGPTGVGKTHIAKTLARLYFGSEQTMLRLDMSEYQNQDSIHRLTSREAGSLVEHIRNTPYALILLDEIEKAHPRILDLFLQILDDARLTDEHGSTADFTQTVIIATTNAGNQELATLTPGISYFQSATDILQKYFRTEFLNRFDDIIAFEPLSEETLLQIVDLKIKELSQTLYQDKKITITLSPQTRKWLATFGYSAELGARNLNRLIQDSIETKLAQKILSGEIKAGQQITL